MDNYENNSLTAWSLTARKLMLLLVSGVDDGGNWTT